MIKNLKKRFVITAMSIIGAMVIVIFCAVCIFTYNAHKQQTIKRLEQVVNAPVNLQNNNENILIKPNSPYFPNDQKEPYDKPFELPDMYAIKVITNSRGEIVYTNVQIDLDESQVKDTVSQVLEKKKDSGKISSANLLYLKKETPDGTTIVFTSTSPLDTYLRNTIIISSILCIISFILFFILVERIADYTVKPVKQAWNSQKQFVADASHDLKTPLTVILANNEILLSHKDDTVSSQSKWIESTKEEAEKMNKLVIQLLDLAKSESLQKSITFSQINLSEVTEMSVLQFEPVAFDKLLTVEANVKPNITLNTNEEIYSRIISILLDNAIKYSANEEKIKISLYEDKKQVFLTVNNPAYIENNDINHIFERFYRANKTRNDKGHGLGLAIAKNLALSINGDLTAISSQKEGTTFILAIRKK